MKQKLFSPVVITMIAMASVSFVTSCGDDEWKTGDVHKYIDYSQPKGHLGTEDMFGVYLCTSLEDSIEAMKQRVDGLKASYDYMYNNDIQAVEIGMGRQIIQDSFRALLPSLPNAIRIEDESKIYSLHTYATVNNNFQKTQFFWSSFDINYCEITSRYHRKYTYTEGILITVGVENYPDSSGQYDEWYGLYAIDGDKLLVNTDESGEKGTHKSHVWNYRDGTIIVTNDDGSTLTYVKYNKQ